MAPATQQDAALLTSVCFAAKRSWGYPDAWMEHWRESLTLSPELISSGHFSIARIGVCVAGFYGFICAGEDCGRLEHLWILPQWQRRGIGRALFQHAAQHARSLGVRQFEIEADSNAEPFYLRMGARRITGAISFVAGVERRTPILLFDLAGD